MRVSQLTRIALSAVILIGIASSCALIVTGHFAVGLLAAAAAIAVAMGSHYVYSIRPISDVVAAYAPQLEEVGFERCDDVQVKRLAALLDDTRTLSERPVDVLQAVGVRLGNLSVIWVQYIARRNLQLGFAWVAGFPESFRGPGRLVPTFYVSDDTNGHTNGRAHGAASDGSHVHLGADSNGDPTFAAGADDADAFERAFEPDAAAIDHLIGEMPLAVRRQLGANPHFVYEFNGPHLLADFYVSRDTCRQASQRYFGEGVASFLKLLSTIETSRSMFEPCAGDPASANHARAERLAAP